MGFKLNNVDHFNSVMAFASLDSKRLTNLIEKLHYLLTYGEPHPTECPDDGYTEVILSSDFAAHSFLFTCVRVAPFFAEVIEEERRHLMTGGLIFDERTNTWECHT